MLKLHDWIDETKLDLLGLCHNPNAISLINKNLEKLCTSCWKALCKNPDPNAIHLLEQNPDKIDWWYISANPNALSLLNQNPRKIRWEYVCLNPNPDVIPWLEERLEKANGNWVLAFNSTRSHALLSQNPNAINLLKKYSNKLYWPTLSLNPSAISLLKQHPEHIDWNELARNPNAISLIEKRLENSNDNVNEPDDIYNNPRFWFNLSENPNAIHLLKKYPEKIEWHYFSKNPSIFTYDYDAMHERCLIFKEELMKNRFHPRNLGKFRDWRIDGFDSDSDGDDSDNDTQ